MRYYLMSALALAVVASACTREMESITEIQAEPVIEEKELSPEAGYVPGITIVQFDDRMTAMVEQCLESGLIQTKSAPLDALFGELNVKSITPVFPEDECPPEYRQRERDFGLRNFYYVEFDNSAVPVTKASTELSSIPGIISAEPQPLIRINDNFNDPMLSQQWHYINKSTAGADVNCLPVWQSYSTGDPSVIVCVLDQGVDLEHEDLASNCLPGGPKGSRNFTDGTYNIEAMPHGTHVAGTIAAINNNGKGVCGIAGGDYAAGKPGVKIMSCQFFGTESNGSAADGIRWGANHGSVISQNSWGYVVDLDRDGKISSSEFERAKHLTIDATLKASVDYFIKYAGCDASGNQNEDSPMKGGIVIFSAGNDDIQYGAPANYDKILSVAAIDKTARKSSFSNYGDWVDICAPGTSIISTMPGNKYGNMSGTSMACPHVSGVAALVVSVCGGKGFTNDMLWTKLVNGAKYNFVKASGTPIGPLVDAYGAVLYGDTGEPGPVTEFSVSSNSNNISLTWDVTPTSNGSSSYSAMLFASKDKSLLEGMDPSNPPKGVIRASQLTSTYAVGETVTGTISNLEFETQYYVALATYSYNNAYSVLSPVKTATTGKNNPPQVNLTTELILTHKNYEQWTIPFTYSDPDGHDVTVEYTPGSAADALAPDMENGGYLISVNGPLADDGTFTGTIKVSDQYGLSATQSVTFTLLPNNPPVVLNKVENQLFSKPGETRTFPLKDMFEDKDGEPLSFEIHLSDKSVFHAISDGENLVVTSLVYGVSSVSVTATDAKGATAVSSFGCLTREASVEVSVYPNPVVEYLFISTGMAEEDTPITLYTSSGALVYSGTVKTSAFAPAQIEMKQFTPGTYSLVFRYGGKTFKRTIVKK